MKTLLSKTARFSLAIAIPAMLLMGCQEDITQPDQARPIGPRPIPPGQKK